MFKLDLEKAEEPKIKLLTSVGLQKKQESFKKKKTSTSALLTTLKALIVWISKILLKILQEMGIPDHLTFFLRDLYVGQEATVRTRHEMTGSKYRKEYIKAVYCHPAYLTYIHSAS